MKNIDLQASRPAGRAASDSGTNEAATLQATAEVTGQTVASIADARPGRLHAAINARNWLLVLAAGTVLWGLILLCYAS